MNYEELVHEAKRLRHEFEQSEAKFFVFLMEVETKHEGAWREAGCSSFDQFLTSNDLCKPHRYIFFRAGVSRCGSAATAVQNGAHWTIALGQVREDAVDRAVNMFTERASTFLHVHQTSPSEEVVKGWRRDAQPRTTDSNQRPASELARLREENRMLKIDLAKARARISELEGKASDKSGQKKRKAA